MLQCNISLFEQPIGQFGLGVLNAQEIFDYSDIDRLKVNPVTLEIEGGPQRNLSSKRVSDIADYAKTLDATFPTPIILSLNPKFYSLDSDRKILKIYRTIEEKANAESIRIFKGPKDNKPATIIDGQHRIVGIIKSGIAKQYMLPVVFVFNSTEEENAMIFAIINGKQTKVSQSIIYQLYDVTEVRNPYKTAHYIAQAFNTDEESPYYRKLKMLGVRTPGSNEILSQGTFVKELLKHISKKPDMDFAFARARKKCSVWEKCVFNKYFLDNKDELIYKILLNIFSAVKEVFPVEWEDQTHYILSKTTGFIGIMRAVPSLIGFGKRKEIKSLEKSYFIKVFMRLKYILEHEERPLKLINDDFGSSESGQKKLTQFIIQAINELDLPDIDNSFINHVNSMKEWFLSIYEDPAANTPYDSHEGGYLFNNDTIDDTYSALCDKFSSQYSEEEIKEAAHQLEDENYTFEWVKKS